MLTRRFNKKLAKKSTQAADEKTSKKRIDTNFNLNIDEDRGIEAVQGSEVSVNA